MPNLLIYGANEVYLDVAGRSVERIESALAEILNLSPDAAAYVDGKRVKSNFLVQAGQRIEWMKERGKKGANFIDVEDFCDLYGLDENEFDWCVKEGMEVLQSKMGPRTIEKSEAAHFGRKLMQQRSDAGRPQLPDKQFFDETTFSVMYQAKSCHLGNTIMFRLFKRLAARPGIYVNVETLKDFAWGHDEFIETNSVHRQFTTLRKKLARAGISEFEIDGKTNEKHYALLIKR